MNKKRKILLFQRHLCEELSFHAKMTFFCDFRALERSRTHGTVQSLPDAGLPIRDFAAVGFGSLSPSLTSSSPIGRHADSCWDLQEFLRNLFGSSLRFSSVCPSYFCFRT